MRLELDEEDVPGISLAPLIDVVFLLLIFFLVASVLGKPGKTVPVSAPRMESAKAVPAGPTRPRVLAVDAAGHFSVDGEPVTRAELAAFLDVLMVSGTRLRLDVDEDAPTKNFAEVLEMVRVRGITNFALRARSGGLAR